MMASEKASEKPVLQIDLQALEANYSALKTRASGADISAVVKANAYGLGAVEISKVLWAKGCRNFWVAQAFEGAELRKTLGGQARIYVLNGPTTANIGDIERHRLIPVLNTIQQINLWVDHAEPCALHFDTGMNRLGLKADEAKILLENHWGLAKLNVDTVMSHLACAPDRAHPLNHQQLEHFSKLTIFFPNARTSLANSAGIFLGEVFHFDMVRPGCALYGLKATKSDVNEGTKPIASLHAPIVQLAGVRAGETAGYNAHWTADSERLVATLPLGYADGFPVLPSSARLARYKKQTFPIIGRVSMDLTLVDVTDCKTELNVGDYLTLLGEDTEETAAAAGCLNYELLTRLGSRFERQYTS